MIIPYALHKIKDPDRPGFNPHDYSRFKFGDDTMARSFGYALADGFIRKHLDSPDFPQPIVVISSPYSFIPTATFAMKNHFVARLNRHLAQQNLPVVEETKVHRTVTYKEDYGALSAEERMQLIGNDSFHIDHTFVKGKTLLFLDDIRITGSHERMILKMTEQYQLNNKIFLLYFAQLDNPAIHPRYENFLNYYFVKSVFDIENIVNNGAFVFNTRVIKYILNSDFVSFKIFSDKMSEHFLNTLYDLALGNSYHQMESYAQNLDYLNEILLNKHSTNSYHGH
jgi:PRTase ComF-like